MWNKERVIALQTAGLLLYAVVISLYFSDTHPT